MTGQSGETTRQIRSQKEKRMNRYARPRRIMLASRLPLGLLRLLDRVFPGNPHGNFWGDARYVSSCRREQERERA